MSKTICLVDDDPSVRKALSRLLESAGIGVYAFATGEDFLSYAVSHPVSVVVLDIWMDRMNGLEVLVHLCSLSPKTRLIIITGREDSRSGPSRPKSAQPFFLNHSRMRNSSTKYKTHLSSATVVGGFVNKTKLNGAFLKIETNF